MNSPVGTRELLNRLDALKAAVQTMTVRETELKARFREQSQKANSAFATQDQQQLTMSSERLGTEAETFTGRKQVLEYRQAKRREWIQKAQAVVRDRTLAEVERMDADCQSQSQQGLITAEQQRDTALTQAATRQEQFQQRLANAQQQFGQVEQLLSGAMGGFGKFRRQLKSPAPLPEAPNGAEAALNEVEQLMEKLMTAGKQFKAQTLARLFHFLPCRVVGVILPVLAAGILLLQHHGYSQLTTLHAVLTMVLWGMFMAAYFAGQQGAAPVATQILTAFNRSRRLLAGSAEKNGTEYAAELARIETEFQTTTQQVNQDWKRTTKEIAQLRSSRPQEIEQYVSGLLRRNERLFQVRLQRLVVGHEKIMAALKLEAERMNHELTGAHQGKIAQIEKEFQANWQILETDWQQRVLPLFAAIETARAAAEQLQPGWLQTTEWQVPKNFANAIRFGQLDVDLGKFFGTLPQDSRLALPCPPQLSLPLLLTHPQQGSLLFETGKEGGPEAVATINHLILRLLATTPPGRIEFTIFDPVGLGQSFASLMHLADYESGTINSRIWTQAAQFEEKLAELNEHMEKIIQMYLRNEYATITEYNAEAGSVAEKYHFLVIASFPVNFSEAAGKRLRNIAANGARCGVFTLIQWDQRNAVPQDFVPDELRQHSIALVRSGMNFSLLNWNAPGIQITLDPAPPAEFTTQLLHQIGQGSRNANRVEVPFEQVVPAKAEYWTAQTAEELRVPIGRSGATKLQQLAIGRDTRQHALIAGKTGSGKSTLFHIIITNLALRCSPEQVEFYLVDFKKGVEFKCYATHRLPHAKVVAIESDRAFGLSVLQRVDEELRRRGDLFRRVGAQDLVGYQRSGGQEPVPRTLLMIDEFQEFFVEEDRISQNAAVLLDRIVRQGRAFGIHVILGSQTLGGAYTLARATIGQMVIRVALQCNEADAYLIMDQDNPAPRLLSRPGEGIYNDAAGAIEGNSPFQAVWLSDRTREQYLGEVRALADHTGRNYPGPIVFEGNAPADVQENALLRNALQQTPATEATPGRVWLGTPNSIKGPTEAAFRRQSGSHLLVVGQSDERMLTILAISLVSLAAHHTKTGAQFHVLHNLGNGNPQLDFFHQVIRAIPQSVQQAGNAQLTDTLATLTAELKRRQESDATGPEIYVLVHDLQSFKKLRAEDEFSFSSSAEATPATAFTELLTNGSAQGIHVILTCDTYGNVNRFLGRKVLSEIEMRVAFQMSASDSASLLDAPDASNLGLHRAVLFNDREGLLETFRPFALPSNGWLEEVSAALAKR